MTNQATVCERCTTLPATKTFFLFNKENKITISSKVCDLCFYDAGFADADPKLVEVFPIRA
jgi:hypothetical protein